MDVISDSGDKNENYCHLLQCAKLLGKGEIADNLNVF